MSLILENARLTNDPSQQTYTITVADEIVKSIVPTSSASQSAESGNVQAERIDIKGDYVAPSMLDNHVHFSVWARARTRVSLSECNSISSVIHELQTSLLHREASKSNDTLVGKGLFIGQWPEEDVPKMGKQILDEQLPKDIPIVVILNDLHSSFCNSAALRLLECPESHSGLFVEQEAFQAAVKLDAMDAHRMEDIIREACIDAAKKGVTEIVDLDMDHNIGNWQKRLKKGMNQLRVHCGMYERHINDAISAGLKSGDSIPDGEGLLTVGPYKIIPDGSLGTRTACCHHAYPSPPAPPGDYGMIVYSEEKLKSMFETAVSNDLQLAVHAIGDKTNTVVLELLAGLKKPLPGSTIEHAQLLRLEDIKHFSDLGLAASIQPQHMNDDRELIERFWPGRTNRAYMFKTLHEAGVELRLGSDAPVAPLDPWVALAAAVWRARPTDTDYSWHPEQKLSMKIAYEASTSGRRIQVKEGDVADLCVLPVDPLQATSQQIWNMKVKATLLAGRFTHREL